MAFPPPMEHTFLGNAADSEDLSNIMLAHLPEIVAGLPPPESGTGCLLADIGNYLVRSVVILSRLSAVLANGDHIRTYAKHGIEFVYQGTEFSDLEFTYYMNSKHQSLRRIATQIEDSARGVESQWENSRTPPDIVKSFGKRSATAGSFSTEANAVECGPMNDADPGSGGAAGGSISSSDTMMSGSSEPPYSTEDAAQASIQRHLNSLAASVRGKGDYYCPLGVQCTKGGVLPDGTIVMFKRNSAFKAHLQKHLKGFKCDIPGCKNKKGFARVDQLQRHRENVHYSGITGT